MIPEIILLLVLLLLNAFLAAAEVAIAEIRKSRLAQLVERGHATAKILERLAHDSSRTLATIRLGITSVRFLAAGTAAVTLAPQLALTLAQARWLVPYSLLLAVLIVTFLLGLAMLVLGELVPKALAARHAESTALLVARPLDLAATLTLPLVRVLVGIANVIAGPLGGTKQSGMGPITEEEIKTIVDAGEEGGVLEQEEKEMIYSIFEFGDKLVREVMVPRIDMVALDAATPLPAAADAIIQAMHSRVPIYQGTIDNVIGVLYAKDLIRVLRAGDLSAPITQWVRPAYFVPDAKRAGDLLQELQKRQVHIAIVVDEYGGVAGLVTIEDILEEIVGEIQDEYDTGEEPLYRQEADGAFVFDARAHLDSVSQLLDTPLPADDSYDTLGGFLYAQLGKVPTAGEQLHVGEVSIQVLNVSGRRIGKVRVRRETPTLRSDDERSGTDPDSTDRA